MLRKIKRDRVAQRVAIRQTAVYRADTLAHFVRSRRVALGLVLPEYSRRQVNRAGDVLISESASEQDLEQAEAVVNNWRGAHVFPLNTFQAYLRRKTAVVNQHGLVAQRTKRLPAIKHKLQRYPNMQLSRMQDIGGCRAVAGSLSVVNELMSIYSKAAFIHELVDGGTDYIQNPQVTGYRGIHLIYKYSSMKYEQYNGLRIEIQLRTWEQHAWATAVEIVDRFKGENLKFGIGDQYWTRFFALMGSVLALREGTPSVKNTPESRNELLDELKFLVHDLDVYSFFGQIQKIGENLRRTMRRSDSQNPAKKYFLLTINRKNKVDIVVYKDLSKASVAYLQNERENRKQVGSDTLLVGTPSIENLIGAYSNYFLKPGTIRRFLREVKMAIETDLSPKFYPGVAAGTTRFHMH